VNFNLIVKICYIGFMGLQEIEKAIEQLPPQDFKTLLSWLDEVRADLWDKQIEADAKAGKLDKLAKQALRDFSESNFTKL
jgi:hypothetical protein